MIIDPIDLKLLRHLEAQGYIPISEIINKFLITKEEILLRVKNFEDEGLISRYGVKCFIPAIAGGKWFRGCAFIDSSGEIEFNRAIPLAEEVIENITIPSGVMPNKVLLFYAQNLKECYRLLHRTPNVKYVEIYKVGEYNVTPGYDLSKEEWRVVLQLFENNFNFKNINTIISEPSREDEVRLSRLLLHQGNRRGLFSIIPEINWNLIKNFAHLHIGITTRLNSRDLKKILKKLRCASNITTLFKKRFLQVEFDLWGFSDIQNILNFLFGENRIKLQGFSFARCNRIIDNWIRDLADERAK
ncbi:MAG: Lrp/AsnC family transcriptional regulator [candidate division WOR-3 bacterium]